MFSTLISQFFITEKPGSGSPFRRLMNLDRISNTGYKWNGWNHKEKEMIQNKHNPWSVWPYQWKKYQWAGYGGQEERKKEVCERRKALVCVCVKAGVREKKALVCVCVKAGVREGWREMIPVWGSWQTRAWERRMFESSLSRFRISTFHVCAKIFFKICF